MPPPWRVVLTPAASADIPRLPPLALGEIARFLLSLELDPYPRGHEIASPEGLPRATIAGCRIVWTDPELTGAVEIARIYPPLSH